MSVASFPKTATKVEELAASIRDEIIGSFDQHGPEFLSTGGDAHGLRVFAPSLAGLPEDLMSSAGIDFGRAVTQPLLNAGACEATLLTDGGIYTGYVVVSQKSKG